MTFSDKLHIIAEIKKFSERLNDWERRFIADMEASRYAPTEKQGKALLTIYEKAVGGGIYQRREYGRRW